MSPSTPSQPIKRKVGAPFGNQNALKHGFYKIKAEVLARLSTDIKGKFEDEIDVIRSLVDTNLSIFNELEHPTLEQCQTTLRGVALSFDTMKGLYLVQRVLYNNQTSVEEAMEELAGIPPELD